QFEISNFGFEMLDSSDFAISGSVGAGSPPEVWRHHESVEKRRRAGSGEERNDDRGHTRQHRQAWTAEPEDHRDRCERQLVTARDASCRPGRTSQIIPHPEPGGKPPAGDIAEGEERDEYATTPPRRDRGSGSRRAQESHRKQRDWKGVGTLRPQDCSAAGANGC